MDHHDRKRQPESTMADAMALCERAEQDMQAMEDALSGYRVAVAALVLRLRERQKHDPRRMDGTYSHSISARRARENETIERAHAHDSRTISALQGAIYAS